LAAVFVFFVLFVQKKIINLRAFALVHGLVHAS